MARRVTRRFDRKRDRYISRWSIKGAHYSFVSAADVRRSTSSAGDICAFRLGYATQSPLLLLAAAARLAASFSFSACALAAGANCSITVSRLKEAAFWRGGNFT